LATFAARRWRFVEKEMLMTSSFDSASVKACVFDVFGTVVDWRGSIIAEGESYWRAKGVDIDWAAFAEAWRAGYGPAMSRVRTGDLPWTNLDALHRMQLDPLLEQFKINLSAKDIDHLNKIWHRLKGWPDSSRGLTRLKTRYVISPLSNGNVALLTNMGKFAGLPWDCILGAEIFHHYKPDPEVYLGAAEILGLQPSEVMMCAAHGGDLLAASKLGLRTAYIYRPLERGPGRTVERFDSSTFDVAVESFEELASALGV
jgi:2-haloacid dehalogenase